MKYFVTANNMFQFQYGTIKRGFAKPKTPHDNSFNSNMVRLKERAAAS